MTSLTTGAATTTYSYDGDGNRASTTSGGATTTYIYDLENTLPALVLEDNGSSVLERYLYADGLLLAANVGGANFYVAHDAQGSVVGDTSASGATEATYTYGAFGNLRTSNKVASSPPSIPLGYEAQLLDPSGLFHLGARQMDPTTGTFLSPDPLASNPLTPAISFYLYVEDQPTVLWDPSGESAVTDGIDLSGLGLDQSSQSAIRGYLGGLGIVTNFAQQQAGGQAPEPSDVLSANDVPSVVSGPASVVSNVTGIGGAISFGFGLNNTVNQIYAGYGEQAPKY